MPASSSMQAEIDSYASNLAILLKEQDRKTSTSPIQLPQFIQSVPAKASSSCQVIQHTPEEPPTYSNTPESNTKPAAKRSPNPTPEIVASKPIDPKPANSIKSKMQRNDLRLQITKLRKASDVQKRVVEEEERLKAQKNLKKMKRLEAKLGAEQGVAAKLNVDENTVPLVFQKQKSDSSVVEEALAATIEDKATVDSLRRSPRRQMLRALDSSQKRKLLDRATEKYQKIELDKKRTKMTDVGAGRSGRPDYATTTKQKTDQTKKTPRTRVAYLPKYACIPFIDGACNNLKETCPSIHTTNSAYMPHCYEYLTDLCTRAKCPYHHVNLGRRAKVCENFFKLGLCVAGKSCMERHVIRCVEYESLGVCAKENCKFYHGTLEKEDSNPSEIRSMIPVYERVGNMALGYNGNKPMDDTEGGFSFIRF